MLKSLLSLRPIVKPLGTIRSGAFVSVPLRCFPRGIYKEQQLQRETKYRFREIEPEKHIEEKDAQRMGRKEIEQFKEGERAYAKFNQETAAQDQEFEKEIERLIDQKMAEGLDDERILDQILTGGDQTLTRADIDRLEQAKEEELIREMLSKGQKPISMEDAQLFGDEKEANRFEDFQQKAGKMMYEQDMILMEKWAEEEKQRRLLEKDGNQKDGPIYTSSKAKR